MKRLQQKEVLIALLVIVNTLIKGWFIGSNALANDEPFSVYHAQMSAGSIIQQLTQGNNPPLYELILHFWSSIAGISETAVRLPSLFFSGVTMGFVFAFADRFFNRRVALFSSFIFILSNYHLQFAQEARGYALMGMLTMVSMYYFLRLIQLLPTIKTENKGKTWRIIAYYVLASTSLIYTHYFGFFVLLVQFLFIAGQPTFVRRHWKTILVIVFSILLLYLPLFMVAFQRWSVSTSQGTWLTPPSSPAELFHMFRRFCNAPVVAASLLLVCISALIAVLVRKQTATRHNAGILVIIWFCIIFFFMFVVSYAVPMFLDRYLMPAAIAFCLVVGLSLDALIQKRYWRNVPGLLIVGLFSVTVKPQLSNKREVKTVVQTIQHAKTKETAVLVCPAHFSLNFAYYYQRKAFEQVNEKDIYATISETLQKERIYFLTSFEGTNLKGVDHVLYLDAAAAFQYPNNGILEGLKKEFREVKVSEIGEIFRVYEFKRVQVK